MVDTVTKAELRSAESGPVLSGNAGDVLTFGSDGRTVQGAPVPVTPSGRTVLTFVDTVSRPPTVFFTTPTDGWYRLTCAVSLDLDTSGVAAVEIEEGMFWKTSAFTIDEAPAAFGDNANPNPVGTSALQCVVYLPAGTGIPYAVNVTTPFTGDGYRAFFMVENLNL